MQREIGKLAFGTFKDTSMFQPFYQCRGQITIHFHAHFTFWSNVLHCVPAAEPDGTLCDFVIWVPIPLTKICISMTLLFFPGQFSL